MKKVFLTFDYELFFGKDSGSLDNSLLKPTDLLLDSLKENQALATFYVDTMYIERLNSLGKLKDDYKKVKRQIQRMLRDGHRVELHLHPHWNDAIYLEDTNRWKFPSYEHYRLQSYGAEKIGNIFDESVKTLYSIIHEVDPSYKFISYRAGGWCIQPFNLVKPSLERHNIYIDSSVVPELSYDSKAQYFNFKNTPKKAVYHFSDDPIVEDEKGDFIEVPSSVISMNFYEKILNKLLKRYTNCRSIGDGRGIEVVHSGNVFSRFKSSSRILSLDDISSHLIKHCLNKSEHTLIVFLSHPKFLSQDSFRGINEIAKVATFKTITKHGVEI